MQALDDFLAFQNLGNKFPVEGGYDDQPHEWVEGITAVQTAYNKATAEIQEDIDKKERQKAKRRK